MAKVISLINMKGGVGKSTLAVNLAWHLAGYTTWSKNVLLVDLDPQFNASQYVLGVNRYSKQVMAVNRPTVWDIFEQVTHTPTGGTPKMVKPDQAIMNLATYTTGNRLDLLPSRLELAWSLKNPAGKERMLEKFLAKVQDKYDVIIVDCAPTESVLTTASYMASDYVLVPVKPEYLSTIGLPLLARSLQEFHTQNDDYNVDMAGIVFNHASDYAPEESTSKAEVRAMAANLGWHVFNSEIRYSRSYPKGAREGRPIFRTSKARGKAKTRFHVFTQELVAKVGV